MSFSFYLILQETQGQALPHKVALSLQGLPFLTPTGASSAHTAPPASLSKLPLLQPPTTWRVLVNNEPCNLLPALLEVGACLLFFLEQWESIQASP